MHIAGLVAVIGIAILSGAAAPPSSSSSASNEPITITEGGTYSGVWVSPDSRPAVTIATSEPVTIVKSTVVNLAGGSLIESFEGGAEVTVAHVRGYGGASHTTSGRFFIANGYRSVVIRNCTIENTRGIQLEEAAPAATVLITRNKHHNIQGNGTTPVGNFVQFRVVQTAAIEVSWNEVVNEHRQSDPEDIVSIYQTANVRLHNNYLQHQSKPGSGTSSQNGVTIDPGDNPPAPALNHDNEIWNNQVVDGAGIGIFGGNDNFVHDNRIIQDGFLPDGRTGLGPGFYEPVWIAPGYTNNHMHRNVIGYVNQYGRYMHGRYTGASEGDLVERSKNRYLGRKTLRGVERNERKRWLAKVAANRVRLGAWQR